MSLSNSNTCLSIPPYWKAKLIPTGPFLVVSVFHESTLMRRSVSIPSSDGASVLLGIGLGLNSAAKQRVPQPFEYNKFYYYSAIKTPQSWEEIAYRTMQIIYQLIQKM